MAEARTRRPSRAILALGLVAIAILVVIIVMVPLGGSQPESRTVGGHPLLGLEAPEIELPTLDGESATLSGLRGHPVLVNFWATWCIPCRDEFPLMVAAYEDHADDGLEILGVVHDDGVQAARAFAAEMGATWPMLDDADDVAWKDYVGVGVPTSVFIDTGGVIRAFSLGPFTEASLTAQLRKILPTPSALPVPTATG